MTSQAFQCPQSITACLAVLFPACYDWARRRNASTWFAVLCSSALCWPLRRIGLPCAVAGVPPVLLATRGESVLGGALYFTHHVSAPVVERGIASRADGAAGCDLCDAWRRDIHSLGTACARAND